MNKNQIITQIIKGIIKKGYKQHELSIITVKVKINENDWPYQDIKLESMNGNFPKALEEMKNILRNNKCKRDNGYYAVLVRHDNTSIAILISTNHKKPFKKKPDNCLFVEAHLTETEEQKTKVATAN